MRGSTTLLLLILVATALGGTAFSSSAEEANSAPMMADDCSSRSSAVQPLATVTNTYDRNYHCLGVRVDAEADVMAIRFESHRPGGRDTAREFSPAEIASDRGAVLDGRPGHDAVILRGQIAAHAASSALTLEFLRNGLTGEYRRCALTLARDSARDWRLLDAAGRREDRIVVETWGLPVIGTLGIADVRGVCAPPPPA